MNSWYFYDGLSHNKGQGMRLFSRFGKVYHLQGIKLPPIVAGIVTLGLVGCASPPPPSISLAPEKLAPAPVKELESQSIIENDSHSQPNAAPDTMMDTVAVQPLKPRFMEPKKANPVMTIGALKLYSLPEPGRLLRAKIPPGSRLWHREREIKVTRNGLVVFALHRDSQGSTELEIHRKNGAVEVISLPIQPRPYDIQTINNLPTEVVAPDPAGLTRIADDNAKIRASRTSEAAVTGYSQSLRWPAYGRISGIFGSQRILNGIPRAFHAGIDIAAPMGTELCAPADAVVSLVAPNLLLTGNTLGLDHGLGVSSIFAHLSGFKVKLGQKVRRGQLIATIGMTGRATGPHVHWGMFWNEIAFDPALLLSPPPEPIGSAVNRCPIRK